MTKDTAIRQYRQTRERVQEQLGRLFRGLDSHARRAEARPSDWSFAGDLGHLTELLSQANETVGTDRTKRDSDVEIKLPEKIPGDYEPNEMLADLRELDDSIDRVIGKGYLWLAEEDYELAGSAFTDVGDLEEIRSGITEGAYDVVQRLIANLDTAVRDEIPTRLYDRIVNGPDHY